MAAGVRRSEVNAIGFGRALELSRAIGFVSITLFALPVMGQTLPQAPQESSPTQPAGTAEPSLLKCLESVPRAQQLRAWHDLLGSEPHIAGTDGDAREIRRIEIAFRQMGLTVETHDFWALLARPISARVEIVDPNSRDVAVGPSASTRRGVLPVIEKNLAEDPAAAHPDLTWGWNAYSASADVTSEIVYANYGTREDFARLKELGIDVNGKIVLARYGGNFRGYKAKFAQEAGAVGLLIYTDPADSGFKKGDVYPTGTWANDTCIQRGSILSLPYPGDPLTPGVCATKDAVRLDPDAIDLPKIPVQPIGYGAAGQILAKMTGAEVSDVAWRGGLEMPYPIEGGAALKVRMKVEQKREIRRTANVIARLKGSANDGSVVIIGCHHDAWGFGAADPLAGTIVLMETARAFAECAAKGVLPKSDIMFCAWGAEEFGIIGSTEWVEAHADELVNATAYINLDMASMGMNLGFSASPSLQSAVAKACGVDAAKIGLIGGGSDHVGFLFRCAVPCISISAGGSPGTSYHSNYDTTAWYRKTVGEDYASAMIVTRATLEASVEIADRTVSPVSALSMVTSIRKSCSEMRKSIASHPTKDDNARIAAVQQVDDCFGKLEDAARAFDAEVAVAPSHTDAAYAEALAKRARSIDRALLDERGVPGRTWFRNLSIASDRNSGYKATALPSLAEAEDFAEIAAAADRLCACADKLGSVLSGK